MTDPVFPVAGTVEIRRVVERNEGGAFWNDFSDPEPLEHHGFYISGGEMPGTDGRILQVDYDAVVFVAAGSNVNSGDRIILPGIGVCDVEAPPGDWNNGPWWSPGLVQVRLKRSSRED